MDKDTTRSVLAEYLVLLNTESIFQELNRLQLDRYVKKLGTAQFMELFVFAQVKQIGTLTDMSLELEANENLQKEIDLESISTSQLSRKLRHVPNQFTDFVFRQCVEQMSRQVGVKRMNENWDESIWSIHLRFPCVCRSIVGLNFGRQKQASSCIYAWYSSTIKWYLTK